ncbi:MAG: glycosyltransferase family 39 protein [Candidatus Omnitrophica bacterium]|jgi:hypothetical protein|nr:glycosyltransferase family 39 protein [Candidatus Omnitrophota bacterium]
MTKINKVKFCLIFIIGLGFLLRVWGINFGLPYQSHQDEPIIVNHALAYGSGDFNPHFFIIPPLTSYILFFFYGVYFVILKIFGVVANTEVFAISFFRNPTPFYVIGRIVIGVVPSICNVYLTYRLARIFFSEKVALCAASIMAISFINTVNAHYIYTDNLLVFWVLLAYIKMASLIKQANRKNYAMSAIFIALAAATKYNAILLLVPFLYTHFYVSKKNIAGKLFNLNLAMASGVIIATFLLANPFAFLDWKFFLYSVTTRIRHGYIGWGHHLTYSLFEGIGGFMTLLAIAGLCLMLIRKYKIALFLVLFPFCFYIHLAYASQPFSRYVLVLIPFLAIGLGYILFDFFSKWPRPKLLQTLCFIISVIVMLPTVIKSIKADMLFASEDTRLSAAHWIEQHIPVSSRILFDNTSFMPQLSQTTKQLQEKQTIIDKQPELKMLKNKKLDFQIKAFKGNKTYEIYYLGDEAKGAGQFLNLWPIITGDAENLEKYKIEYIVFNNMTGSDKAKALHKVIYSRHKPVAIFNPYKDSQFRSSYDMVDETCLPVKDKELFSRTKSGPYIIIYKIRQDEII